MNTTIKNQIHQIIDELIKLSEWIKDWIITNKEHDESFSTNMQKIYSTLEKDSFEYKKFDNWKTSKYLYSTRTIPWYCNSDSKILDLIWILKEITWYNQIENEKHFKIWDNYEIVRYFWKLFQNTKNEVLIVDSYVDSNLFDYIEEIEKI
jgi:hypothetical protein